MYISDRSQSNSSSSGSDVAIVPSIFLPFLCLISLISCLGFIKRTARFIFRKRTKKTTQCQRISTVSGSDSVIAKIPHTLRFQDFRDHFQGLASDSYYKLSEEFEGLKVNEPIPSTAADIPVNRLKNRFVNILPFDHSRVLLAPLEDIEGSDYINANYVSGFHSNKEFIATQGPLKSTTNDFWRMCWESNTRVIVMLTKCVDKEKEKCYRYWPTGPLPQEYGQIEVEVVKESLESCLCHDWIVADIILRKEGEERLIKHFQFLTWPDFGAVEPVEALIDFIKKVRTYAPHPKNHRKDEIVPIVVHCSAGVGRSGTLIAVDIALQKIQADNEVDIFDIVYKMRRERVWMVQTEQQYICVYKCVLAIINSIDAKKSPASVEKMEDSDESKEDDRSQIPS